MIRIRNIFNSSKESRHEMKLQRKVVIFLGPPGSGKSSVAAQIAKTEDVNLLETGELLRHEVKSRTILGRKIKSYLDQGVLAPSDLVKKVVIDHVREQKGLTWIFNGFPRLMEEVNDFFEIEIKEDLMLDSVFVFQVSQETIMDRLRSRRVCSICGKVYNLHFDPPRQDDRCNECDSLLIQRSDDTPKIIRERLDVYRDETEPVIEHFITQYPEKTHFINSEGTTESIVNDIQSILRAPTNVSNHFQGTHLQL